MTVDEVAGSVDSKGVPRTYSEEESLEKEWEIVASSISDDELQRLRAFADVVQDLDNHPACARKPLNRQAQTLLRFLRGREGNVAAAGQMFRASLDWRHSFRVDDRITAWRQELDQGTTKRARLFRAYGTDAELCEDRAGVPLWLMRLSVSDPAGMLREVGQEVLLVNSLSRIEAMHAHLRRAMFREGRLVRGCVQVIDVGDYGEHGAPNWWSRMWDASRVGKTAFKIFDANYPETTRKIFIVRMGRVTTTIYQLVMPLVPQRTREKMRIFGASASEWGAELRGEVPGGSRLPGFLISDRVEAFASARPRGGLVPAGGEVPQAVLESARMSDSCSLEPLPPGGQDRIQPRAVCTQETACDAKVLSLRRFPVVPLTLFALAAALTTARALSLIDFGGHPRIET